MHALLWQFFLRLAWMRLMWLIILVLVPVIFRDQFCSIEFELGLEGYLHDYCEG